MSARGTHVRGLVESTRSTNSRGSISMMSDGLGNTGGPGECGRDRDTVSLVSPLCVPRLRVNNHLSIHHLPENPGSTSGIGCTVVAVCIAATTHRTTRPYQTFRLTLLCPNALQVSRPAVRKLLNEDKNLLNQLEGSCDNLLCGLSSVVVAPCRSIPDSRFCCCSSD